jgi:hypothetical protein
MFLLVISIFLNLHFQALVGVVRDSADFVILKNQKANFYSVLPESGKLRDRIHILDFSRK